MMREALAAVGTFAKSNAPAADRRPLPDDVRSLHSRLLALLDHTDADERLQLEGALRGALDATRPAFLGHHLLGSALIRSIASNPRYWDFGSGPSPRGELLVALDEAVEAIGRDDSPYATIGEGVRRFVSGDDDAAFASFARASRHALFARIVRDDFIGARTCREFPSAQTIREAVFPAAVGDIDWLLRDEPGAEPYVISYFCDDSYFRAFAPCVLASLPREATGLTVHFHVVNPGPPARELAAGLAIEARSRRLSLSVSAEETAILDRAYYASARFFRMREFLTSFDRPLLFLDVDTEFETDPRSWCDGFVADAVNVLFCRGPWSGGYVPWRAFWAGMVYVPQNTAGRHFAEAIHGALAYLWSPLPHANWFIDQNAIYVAYRIVECDSASVFEDVPPERYKQLRHTPEHKRRLREIDEPRMRRDAIAR
jgi:hypothetical protein